MFDTELKHGVVPEAIGIIAVGIPGGELIEPLGEQVPKGMGRIRWMSCIVHSGGQAFRQADLAIDPT
jgi:hypothetical protein